VTRPGPGERVPWHRSLVVRLFALGALIALVAVVAATWATVRATTVAVQEEQQESLHADAQTYDALIGYAATHRSWSGAQALVDRLARGHDGDVVVTDTTGQVLVTSGSAGEPLPPDDARARLDPLDVDTALLDTSDRGAAKQREPFPTTATPCDRAAETAPRECSGVVAPTLALDPRVEGPFSGDTARPSYIALEEQIDACLTAAGLAPTTQLTEDLQVVVPYGDHHRTVAGCLDEALRTSLTPYVAPPALLHVTGEGSQAQVFWDLSGRNQTRIALLAGGVLLVTLLLSALLAATIAGPLRRMAATARLAGAGDLGARMSEGRRDEVGAVADAFNRMAERRQELEDARRRMVSDVSHELRTPLANVRGWVEAAQDGVVGTDDRLLASLHEESLHLQRLVDDLHDLALGDVGELRLDPQPIDLQDFLDQVATSFRATAEATLEVSVEPGAGVEADPVRLRQAVGNLVANALRHTPAGGRVTLRGAPGTVVVADTGEGIPADELPFVFDRFRRVDPSRSRATGGSGLGLAIVRQIAESHGGSVAIRSTPGEGTEVTLRLPSPGNQETGG
jgi:two-component system sensor histidine kinase BaeS